MQTYIKTKNTGRVAAVRATYSQVKKITLSDASPFEIIKATKKLKRSSTYGGIPTLRILADKKTLGYL